MKDLPEFFQSAFPPTQVSVDELLLRLCLALALGGIVAAVYRFTHRSDSPATPSFVATLVLLSVIIAMVTQVVGESVGRAFTLVGALSIVRFRTVVEDTRDTAFVIFAVVIGMASGLGNLQVALIGLVVVGSAAAGLFFLQRFTHRASADWILQLRISTGAGSATPWDDVFARHCAVAQLVSTATAQRGASLDLTYNLRLKGGVTPMQLLNDINRIEGIQNVEMKRA
jgi:Domain of unknown function (DUF4956)